MISKSLSALVMAAHEIEIGRTLPPTYFISKGLGPEGKELEEKRFIEIITKERERSYAFTSTGKEVLSSLDEYYEIIFAEHS
jgi:hypothetical protein